MMIDFWRPLGNQQHASLKNARSAYCYKMPVHDPWKTLQNDHQKPLFKKHKSPHSVEEMCRGMVIWPVGVSQQTKATSTMCKVREWMCLRAAKRFFSQANVRPWHSREFTCKEQTCCSGSTLAPSPPPHPVPYPTAEVLARCSLFASNLFSWKDHQHDALASM